MLSAIYESYNLVIFIFVLIMLTSVSIMEKLKTKKESLPVAVAPSLLLNAKARQ